MDTIHYSKNKALNRQVPIVVSSSGIDIHPALDDFDTDYLGDCTVAELQAIVDKWVADQPPHWH